MPLYKSSPKTAGTIRSLTWMELMVYMKKSFNAVKTKLIKKLTPLKFVLLEEFQKQTIFAGKFIGMYICICMN